MRFVGFLRWVVLEGVSFSKDEFFDPRHGIDQALDHFAAGFIESGPGLNHDDSGALLFQFLRRCFESMAGGGKLFNEFLFLFFQGFLASTVFL